MSAAAVRTRSHEILNVGLDDALRHFAVDVNKLDAAADYVTATIRATFPDLSVPFHSRWRHFTAGGIDRWANLAPRLQGVDAEERARIRFELAITSVLLDAGAGDSWRYREAATGLCYSRSEGLALASFWLYADGGFSACPKSPFRADASALQSFDISILRKYFQVTNQNLLAGEKGRVHLIRGLGQAVERQPQIFGPEARLAGLYDYLAGQASAGGLRANSILQTILRALDQIWPGRVVRRGCNLGDVWPHPAVRHGCEADPTDGLVPFHKLSQWLAYSLIEPMEEAGLKIHGLNDLTGLPEYRNGGLLIDCGVLRPREPSVLAKPQSVESELVVEWRALTVALLDRLAPLVRARLNMTAEAFPLARVLEGGTWRAGRKLAGELRRGGPPPIRLDSDGTVF